MVCLALFYIDLAVEIQLDVVGKLFGIGVAGECKRSRLEIDFA